MTYKGITLVETMVVVSIIAILVIAFGFSYEGWMGKYRIESQIKEVYSDLMEARTRAMTRNMLHFAVINTDNYAIYEDTNNSYGNSPDAEDQSIWSKPKTLIYNYQFKMISSGTLPRTLTFDTRGLISNATAAISFRIDNSLDPDFDCLIIDEARIRMGKTNTTGTACDEK
ncbi:MAG: prepilin-type N-terminal cleavage/methylation domain-containing protein [Nitrospirae bacterium]|nr:prepilin-type N-terminal cleavage/methylation domain-containing protein [Nitrospirota bacterium]